MLVWSSSLAMSSADLGLSILRGWNCNRSKWFTMTAPASVFSSLRPSLCCSSAKSLILRFMTLWRHRSTQSSSSLDREYEKILLLLLQVDTNNFLILYKHNVFVKYHQEIAISHFRLSVGMIWNAGLRLKIRHQSKAMTDVRLRKIKNNIKYIREIKGCPMRLVRAFARASQLVVERGSFTYVTLLWPSL